MDNLEVLTQKYARLDEQEKKELREILFGEDPEELLEDDSNVHMFLSDIGEHAQVGLFENIFAFMDAHPMLPTDLDIKDIEVEE